jgi:hypothetical protein
LSAKLVPTFAERGCRVVSAVDPLRPRMENSRAGARFCNFRFLPSPSTSLAVPQFIVCSPLLTVSPSVILRVMKGSANWGCFHHQVKRVKPETASLCLCRPTHFEGPQISGNEEEIGSLTHWRGDVILLRQQAKQPYWICSLGTVSYKQRH